jgi:hypothetical protein
MNFVDDVGIVYKEYKVNDGIFYSWKDLRTGRENCRERSKREIKPALKVLKEVSS